MLECKCSNTEKKAIQKLTIMAKKRQRAISLAAQRFITDIAETAVQLNEVQKSSSKKKVWI